jgi:hypothetical protein
MGSQDIKLDRLLSDAKILSDELSKTEIAPASARELKDTLERARHHLYLIKQPDYVPPRTGTKAIDQLQVNLQDAKRCLLYIATDDHSAQANIQQLDKILSEAQSETQVLWLIKQDNYVPPSGSSSSGSGGVP